MAGGAEGADEGAVVCWRYPYGCYNPDGFWRIMFGLETRMKMRHDKRWGELDEQTVADFEARNEIELPAGAWKLEQPCKRAHDAGRTFWSPIRSARQCGWSAVRHADTKAGALFPSPTKSPTTICRF